jgi:hypothetical protein
MRYEQGGAEALRPKRGGRKSMRTQTLRRRLYKLFATRAELGAFQALLKRVNGLGLTLPGDPAERRLHFEVHI